MDLRQVIDGVYQCMREANAACVNADEKTVRNCLLQAGDLIKSEVGGDDATSEDTPVEEETQKILGQDEQAAADAAGG
ncbi:MAG TPA: hypothetical protein ENH62_11210 [Marinobacter sp.]|uniref:Uncharacterized protein n=1 Tax=marine sediment metagenome TaxID=412755 RepID=A0A0F9JAZ8_9ZZZZ|nr:hypothetical protein [Marinobacter sp.]